MTAVTAYGVEQPQGIYYLDAATITMEGRLVSYNDTTYAVEAFDPNNGGDWYVKDHTGTICAQGVYAAGTTSVVVASAGSFVGGGAIYAGWFLFYAGTPTSTNLVVPGSFTICPTTAAQSHLYVPSSTEPNSSLAAWLGMAQDRQQYLFAVSFYPNDPYFHGVQDANRPRTFWVASGYVANAASTTVASGSNGVNIDTFTGTQTLDVTSSSGFSADNASIAIQMSGSLGSSPTWAMIETTGVGTGVLNDCHTDNFPGFVASGTLDSNNVYGSFWPGYNAWGGVAIDVKAAGIVGCEYELPCNEPEDAGWNGANWWFLMVYYNGAAQYILYEDPNAKPIGWCSNGIFDSYSNLSSINDWLTNTTYTMGVTPINGLSEHMENSHMNMSNLTALRQRQGAISGQFAASGFPDLVMRETETGIISGGYQNYGVLHPRREARQRTHLLLMNETYGWAKETHFMYAYYDTAPGADLGSYMSAGNHNNTNVSMLAGGAAVHALSEALAGTICTPTNKPVIRPFGPTDADGNAMFYYQHYSNGTYGDRIFLLVNGIESDTIDFIASAAPNAANCPDGKSEAWDICGKPVPVTQNSDGSYSVAVDDGGTCLFFPSGTSFRPIRTASGAVNYFDAAVNICTLPGISIVNGSGTSVSGAGLNDGTFNANAQYAYDVPGATVPYSDTTTAPQSLTVSNFGTRTISGALITTAGPPWQTAGCGLLAVSIEVDGFVVYDWTCESAQSFAVPGPATGNSVDATTRTTWWTGAFTLLAKFPPVSGTSVKVSITPSYGGEPDLAASQNTTPSNISSSPFAPNAPQDLYLAQLMVFEEPTQFPTAVLAKFGGC